MVNYKLSFKEGKEFKEIIWNKENYAKFNNHLLKDIDTFTGLFDDNLSLKQELIKIDSLSTEFISRKIGIRYYIKGHISLMQYELVLKDDIKFFDIDFIKSYLKIMKKDIVLLEKLCNHYRNSYINGRNINIIREYINKVLNNEIDDKIIKRLDLVLENFVDREIYTYDPTINTYLVDEYDNKKISYKSLHSLAMFLAYDNKKRLEPKIYIKQNPELDKVKVKSKKKDQIPGQYSLFE